MFPPEGLKFLKGLAKNNNREWFQPRKEIFETQLKAPMIDLIEAVNAELMDFAPEHVTDPKKALYRIYRDTRFSADKTPYKTHIAAIFPKRGGDKHNCAGFYFHISTTNIVLAAGMYMPGPDELRAVRTFLSEHHEDFRKAARTPEKLLGKLEGAALARLPKGFDPASPAGDLIRMKQWIYGVELDLELATSPKFCGELTKRFRAAAPVVALLNSALKREPMLD